MTRTMRIWFLCGCAVVSAFAAPAAWRAGAAQWPRGGGSLVEVLATPSRGAALKSGAARDGDLAREIAAGGALAGARPPGGARAR